jgi:hypothetical protein
MTTLASAIITDALLAAQDPDQIRWTESECLGFLSDGEREIVTFRPAAYARVGSTTLIAGTRQSIPADGIQFIDYVKHSTGRAARKLAKHLLDTHNPDWHSATATAAPQHFVFDATVPQTFYVYPPSTGGTTAEIVYSACPPRIATGGTAINLPDVYRGPLLDYVLYRMFLKDSEFSNNAERAVFHRKAFDNSLGLGDRSSAVVEAKHNARG